MHELQDGGEIGESIKLFLVILSCNSSRPQELQNSDHDAFNAKDMKAVWDFVECGLKRVGDKHIFCSAVHFVSRWWRFCARMGQAEDVAGVADVYEV